jgi:hypothetical protein
MIEEKGNIWDKKYNGCWRGIPINCKVNRYGKLIMGKGLAQDASNRNPVLSTVWGYQMSLWKYPRSDQYGRTLYSFDDKFIGFPTKYHWREKADIHLITKCLIELRRCIEVGDFEGRIVLPRLGCGKETGKLKWADVKPLMEALLKFDNVIVVNDDKM